VEARFVDRSVTPLSARRSGFRPLDVLRWLVVPFAVAVFVVTGLAISSEDRQAFRADPIESGPPPDAQEPGPATAQPRPQPPGGVGTQPAADTEGATSAGSEEGDTRPSGAPPSGGEGTGSNEGTGGDQPAGGATRGGADPAGHAVARITAAAGTVLVELGGERPVIGLAPPSAGGADRDTALDRSAGTDLGRLVLTTEGLLLDEASRPIRPGEVAIGATGRTVEIITSSGDRFTIVADGDDPWGIDVARLDGTEQSAVLPGPDGIVDLGDDVTLHLPLGASAGGAARGPSLWDEATTPPWRWVIVGVLAIAALGALWSLQRRPPTRDQQVSSESPGPTMVPLDRFDELVAMLANDPDPARAIRLAFHAAEQGMGELPARVSTETPFEWFQRIADQNASLGGPLGALCDRFATARFAPDRPTDSDRDATVADLVELHRLAQRLEPPSEPPRREPATSSAAAPAETGR